MTVPPPPGRNPEIEALLPWYLNGTLDARETRQVESYLRDVPEAQEELEWWRSVGRTVSEQGAAPQDDLGWARLSRRLRHERISPSPPQWTGLWQAVSFAACLVIAVQSGFLMIGANDDPSAFRGAAASEQVQIEMTFRPEASVADIESLLVSIDAEIVGGPDPEGRFLIGLKAEEPTRSEIDEALMVARRQITVVRSVAEVAAD